ncbi:MAG: histidine phosphatase family protein [Pseudomonadota bacterium]
MDGAGRRRLFLMRHGHVDYFAPDLTDPRAVPLTDEGRSQADAARQALAGQRFDIAVCSGLPRTRQTAEIVLRDRPIAAEIEDVDGLEELKSGWLRADTREELAARLAFCFDDAAAPGARFLPDGEIFVDAEARIRASIEEIVLQRDWRVALIVAHEGVNRILLGWACGGGLATVRSFEQDLGCINVIDLDVTPAVEGDGLQIERALLKSINITPYDYLKDGLPRTSLEHLFDVDFGAARPLRRDI